MAFDLSKKLVIGVSSRALFDMNVENRIFEEEGVEAYREYQILHESEPMKPGPGFSLIKALLELNRLPGRQEMVEVIIMSRNSGDTALRVFHSIKHYGLNITRAVLTGGAPLAPYLSAFSTDLFLSAHEDDVLKAIDAGIAAGIICTEGKPCYLKDEGMANGQIKIAFDGDAVLFTDESERIFQKSGLKAFEEHEMLKADMPMKEGPFAKFLQTISMLQKEFNEEQPPIRTALVTSRCAPAHERAVKTLRAWGIKIDEVFFLGGIDKKDVLGAFGADIFFDDQKVHTNRAAEAVFSVRVPYRDSA